VTRRQAVSWLIVGLYWALLATVAGEVKLDHLMYGGVILVLFHLGPLGRRALLFLLPFILTGVIYDSQRYWGPHVRGTPHVAEPYLLERSLFGIPTPDGPLTLNEWFGRHLHPVLDLIAGGAYLTFVGIFMLLALFLTVRIYRGAAFDGAEDIANDWSSQRRFWSAQALVWCFLIVNVIGYATWYLYPAAPPWYVDAYGIDMLLLDVPASPGRAARFDDLLGTDFFAGMYGYGSNAFGAIPSLHISYPTLSAFFAFRLGALRAPAVGFLAVMCFSAVYLNHHYVIDVILGVLYGLVAGVITVAAVEWIVTSSTRPSEGPKEASISRK